MNHKCFYLLTFLLFLFCAAYSQDLSDLKPGKITIADFGIQPDSSEAGANAVIISDIGKRIFEKNEVGDEDILFKRFIRVKIVNRNGLDAGQFALRICTLTPYRNILVKLPEEGLTSLEGTTYNLENGIIQSAKLEQDAVIKQPEGKNWMTLKFAMPALKEGSIFDVEYSFRCASHILSPSWTFQYKYPCLWSEYDLTLPDANLYTIEYQGDSSFFTNTMEPVSEVKGNLVTCHFRWVKKNEPSLSTEPFVRTMKNYEDKVTLVYLWRMMSIDNYKFKFTTSENWENFTKIYYFLNGLKDFEDDNFSWMNKDVKQLTTGMQSKKEISFAIFKYIRDHFSCTSHGDYFLSQKLKETFNNKSGNVADLNLLLTAMLRQMHIEAFPAILATVDKGVANLSYPLPGDFNYLICEANVDGEEVLMDASEPLNPYGKLPAYCYNGGAVTLHSKNSKLISLTADSLMEQYRANVILGIDEKGLVSGNFTLNSGPLLSYELRKKLRNISLDKFLREKIKDQVDHFSNEEAQDLKNPDEPLIISSDIDLVNSSKSNLLYINPVIFPYMDKNPFIEVNRKYAIEMPSRIDNVYLLSLDIPKGYVVDEIPASAKIVLRGNDGYFEYLMEKNEDNIQFRMRMKINRTFFTTDEYKDLREFYSQIVKKESEQIVFRKLK